MARLSPSRTSVTVYDRHRSTGRSPPHRRNGARPKVRSCAPGFPRRRRRLAGRILGAFFVQAGRRGSPRARTAGINPSRNQIKLDNVPRPGQEARGCAWATSAGAQRLVGASALVVRAPLRRELGPLVSREGIPGRGRRRTRPPDPVPRAIRPTPLSDISLLRRTPFYEVSTGTERPVRGGPRSTRSCRGDWNNEGSSPRARPEQRRPRKCWRAEYRGRGGSAPSAGRERIAWKHELAARRAFLTGPIRAMRAGGE